MDAHQQLATGIEQLDLSISSPQIEQLIAYLALIQKWNKAFNLVGNVDTQNLVYKHLLDSLAIVPFVQQGSVLDVGSGAGLPGIPLAIALPGISFTLLDANSKKTRFMRQVAMELALNNVAVIQTRVENHTMEPLPNIVLSRAFAPLVQALEMLLTICAPNGQVQIMLGTKPGSLPELDQVKTIKCYEINAPGLDSRRHLLVANKN